MFGVAKTRAYDSEDRRVSNGTGHRQDRLCRSCSARQLPQAQQTERIIDNSCVTCPITRTQTSEDDGRPDVNSRLRSSGTRDTCVETPSTNNPDSSEDVGQYERFTPDRHKIVFKEVCDEHPDSDVDKGHDVSHGETRASA